MNAQIWAALLVGLAAIVFDLARREIPDWIPVAALVSGIGWHAGQYGWKGPLYAAGGAAAGFSVFLIFYLLGGMGGGDIKLMAGFGALLGAGRLWEAALWTAGVGGIVAAAVVVWRQLSKWMWPARTVRAESDSIPYAPAIAVGVWLSLLPKG
jgi:prepilin peptidase CpaA